MGQSFLVFMTTIMTAKIIRAAPAILIIPSSSPKTLTPTTNAVSGSMQPKSETVALSVRLRASSKKRLESTVGMKPKSSSEPSCKGVDMGSNLPLVRTLIAKNKQVNSKT